MHDCVPHIVVVMFLVGDVLTLKRQRSTTEQVGLEGKGPFLYILQVMRRLGAGTKVDVEVR